MSAPLHALLVGIDAYPAPLRPLHGCLNDVGGVEAYLRERFPEPGTLKLCVLRDAQATRSAVIKAFRTHLGRAGPGETAFFHFSGHGSQQPSAPESWCMEPDRLDETLVCWDSRKKGRWDLADKELATLIAEVAAGGAHVAVVLDCCHSGSGTRLGGEGVRGIPADTRVRPPESLLATLRRGWDGWEPASTGRHVLIAACRASELAHEVAGRSGSHGALTRALLASLQRAPRPLTYRDLFKRASAAVRRRSRQTPQLEAPDLRDLHRVFLDGTPTSGPPRLTVTAEGVLWRVDAGAVHGMPAGVPGDRPVLALFPVGTPTAAMCEPTRSVGRAVVTRVEPAHSEVEVALDASSPAEASYAAALLSLPLPPLRVRLDGDRTVVAALRRALVAARSTLVAEAPAEASYRVSALREAHGTTLVLARAADGRVLSTSAWHGAEDARLTVARLEHVAHWETVLRLRNPLGAVPQDGLELTFTVGRRAVRGPDVRLAYTRRGTTLAPPSFRLWVRNRWNRPLYVALLALSEAFEIYPDFLPGERLEPGERVAANAGRPIVARVPDALAREGVTTRLDRLKLLACTEQFDAALLKQPALPAATSGRSASPPGWPVLERLVRGGTSRSSAGGYVGGHDWTSADATVTTVRPSATLSPNSAPGARSA